MIQELIFSPSLTHDLDGILKFEIAISAAKSIGTHDLKIFEGTTD